MIRYLTPLLLLSLSTVSLHAQQTVQGPVTIYDTVYERVDPGAPFTEAPRQEENWQPPQPSRDELKAGLIPFTRGEPFDIKPWSKPKADERVGRTRSR